MTSLTYKFLNFSREPQLATYTDCPGCRGAFYGGNGAGVVVGGGGGSRDRSVPVDKNSLISIVLQLCQTRDELIYRLPEFDKISSLSSGKRRQGLTHHVMSL